TVLRSKLLTGIWNQQEEGQQDNPLARYNALLVDYDQADTIYRMLNKAYAKGELPVEALHPEQRISAAREAGLISEEDARFMTDYEAEVLAMLTVDDFAFDTFARDAEQVNWHNTN